MPNKNMSKRVRSVELEDDWRGPNPLPARRLARLGSGLRKLFPKPARDDLPAPIQFLVGALRTKLDSEASPNG